MTTTFAAPTAHNLNKVWRRSDWIRDTAEKADLRAVNEAIAVAGCYLMDTRRGTARITGFRRAGKTWETTTRYDTGVEITRPINVNPKVLTQITGWAHRVLAHRAEIEAAVAEETRLHRVAMDCS